MGFYADANGNAHGFEHMPSGQLITIDVPGAAYGTYPYGNNAAGDVMGSYLDANGTNHGFVMFPQGTPGSR